MNKALFRHGVSLMTLAAGLCAATSAAAQDQNAPLPVIVVSATAVPTPSAEVPSSVTVITAADIARDQRRTVADLLNSVPGLHVVQTGSPGTQTAVFLRGTNPNHVKVLIDGVDVGDPTTPNGAVDFGHLLTADIEQVEILRGPQSGLYGASAIGGVISITTKKGSGPAKIVSLVEGGSFGTFNQAASVSGSNDRFNYSFNVSHFRADNTPVTPGYMLPPGGSAIGNYYDNWTYSTRLGIDLTPDLAINLFGRYTDATARYTVDSYDFIAGRGFANPAQSVANNGQFFGRAEAVWSVFDGRLINTFGVNYTDYSRDAKDPGASPPLTYSGTREKTDWRGKFTLMPGQIVLLGLEREDEKAKTSNVSARNGNTAGFAELQSQLAERLFLVGNVRYDDNDAFGGHNTWRFAPMYVVPTIGTKLKASYGTGFKAPTLYQLYVSESTPYGDFVGNPALRPETSRGWDMGFEQPVPALRASFGVTYFRNEIEDLIETTFNLSTVTYSYANVSQAATYGVEAFASIAFTDNVRARLDYTHTTAINAVTGVELVRRPKDKYSVNLTWEPTDRLKLSTTFIYLGTWLDYDRPTFMLAETGGVGVLNLAADYKVNDQLNVFARVDNLFDRQYENPLGWLQPGFAVYGGVKFVTP